MDKDLSVLENDLLDSEYTPEQYDTVDKGRDNSDSNTSKIRPVKNSKRKYSKVQEDDSEILLNDMKFMPTHPQRDTHRVSMVEKSKSLVPNFLGGPLPRKDKGDREYYCASMLTLFSPWRSGLDLKKEDQNWDNAFTTHAFSSRENELMKFFHIRYECSDARDDFRANRGPKDIPFEGDLDNDWSQDTEEMDLQTRLYDQLNDESIDYQDIIGIGTHTSKKIEEMKLAEGIARSTGWLDPCLDDPQLVDSRPFIFDTNIKPTEWKTLLDIEKETRATERLIHSAPKPSELLPSQSDHDALFVPDKVKVVDASYLLKEFKAKDIRAREDTTHTVDEFKLNIDQERAFRIIANHAVQPSGEQLRLYLGGMAGTGKSQVFKALASFFDSRNESHRFQMVAPTGSAAVLVGGTTWHALLNIPPGYQGGTLSLTALSHVKTKLQHTDYLLLDEVSMLNCRELYYISRILCQVFNRHEIPFGGLNVILCGDFAQMPPVKMNALYTYKWRAKYAVQPTNYIQESTIGQVIWHQFTTVIILRENMRQVTQTPDDARLRKALENMRYKSCTSTDIKYLTSLTAGRAKSKKHLNQRRFRNISVIVGLNAHRDRWNSLGVERFAQECNVPIHEFLSVDQMGTKPTEYGTPRRRIIKDPTRMNNVIPQSLKHVLWNLSHEASNHLPGKLRLCIGLPVMIKKNLATECCVTNGAEATVVGWISAPISATENALKILFVKLISPPKTIQLPGLPLNVVPIYRTSESIPCRLPNDDILYITRSQVQVLPNFSMTDFASQGRTRPNNVIDLGTCRSHQSYYTALSRSASSEGTIIVQGFDARKVQGGAAADLRQEFRELEIMDDITKLRYEGKLPTRILGHRRENLVREYQIWKGISYLPNNIHPTLKWQKGELLILQDIIEVDSWRIVEKVPKSELIRKLNNDIIDGMNTPNKRSRNHISTSLPALGSKPLEKLSEDQGTRKSNKRKGIPMISAIINPCKRSKISSVTDRADDCIQTCMEPISQLPLTQLTSIQSPSGSNLLEFSPECNPSSMVHNSPIGPMWFDNSCAYDSVCAILYNIFQNDSTGAFMNDARLNSVLHSLLEDFRLVSNRELDINQARNNMQVLLRSLDNPLRPQFQTLSGMVAVSAIITMIERLHKTVRMKYLQCLRCGKRYTTTEEHTISSDYMYTQWIHRAQQQGLPEHYSGHTLQVWSDFYSSFKSFNRICDTCPGHIYLTKVRQWVTPPSCFIVGVENVIDILISKRLTLLDTVNSPFIMRLAGIIYFNENAAHFYCRIIDLSNKVWIHDGLHGSEALLESSLHNLNEEDLNKCRGGRAFAIFYIPV